MKRIFAAVLTLAALVLNPTTAMAQPEEPPACPEAPTPGSFEELGWDIDIPVEHLCLKDCKASLVIKFNDAVNEWITDYATICVEYPEDSPTRDGLFDACDAAMNIVLDGAYATFVTCTEGCGPPCPYPSFDVWRDAAYPLVSCPGDPPPTLCHIAALGEYLDDINFIEWYLWEQLAPYCVDGEVTDWEVWLQLTEDATDVASSCWDLFQYDQGNCCE